MDRTNWMNEIVQYFQTLHKFDFVNPFRYSLSSAFLLWHTPQESNNNSNSNINKLIVQYNHLIYQNLKYEGNQ